MSKTCAYRGSRARRCAVQQQKGSEKESKTHAHAHAHADELEKERDFFVGSKEASNTDLKQQRRGGAPSIHMQANYAV